MQSLTYTGIEVAFPGLANLADIRSELTDRDVVVVCVECAAGLALVADLSGRPGAPPVIAIGAEGFEGKSLEHVLLLAEVRGAKLTLPKPIEAPELVLAASQVQHHMRSGGAPAPLAVDHPRTQFPT